MTASTAANDKPLTIAFENGPTISQHADSERFDLRTLTITGTDADETISFSRVSNSGVIEA
jgi:hypothetical protein